MLMFFLQSSSHHDAHSHCLHGADGSWDCVLGESVQCLHYKGKPQFGLKIQQRLGFNCFVISDRQFCEYEGAGRVHPAGVAGYPGEHGAQQQQSVQSGQTRNHSGETHFSSAGVSVKDACLFYGRRRGTSQLTLQTVKYTTD